MRINHGLYFSGRHTWPVISSVLLKLKDIHITGMPFTL